MTAKPTHGEDDDDENLDKEMTRSLHFGGGDFEPTLKRGDDNAAPERRKSKKDVMDELIAKSKFHKAEKQKQREDDDNTQKGRSASLLPARSVSACRCVARCRSA